MREVIWAVIVLLAGYVAFQLYRALRTGSSRPPVEGDARAGVTAMTASPANAETGDDDVIVFEPAVRTVRAPAGEDFQMTLEVRRLHQEVARLDDQLAAQQGRIIELEAALADLGERLGTTVAGQGMSTEYDEALVFARRGLDAEAIAERCGISVAEAQLVRSLAQQGVSDRGEGA